MPHPSQLDSGNPLAGIDQSGGDLAAGKEVKDQTSVASGDVDQEQGRRGGGQMGGAAGGAMGGKKKSSFERIVEKLAPLYPHYARCVVDGMQGVHRLRLVLV